LVTPENDMNLSLHSIHLHRAPRFCAIYQSKYGKSKEPMTTCLGRRVLLATCLGISEIDARRTYREKCTPFPPRGMQARESVH
jgi:hypothetical protein